LIILLAQEYPLPAGNFRCRKVVQLVTTPAVDADEATHLDRTYDPAFETPEMGVVVDASRVSQLNPPNLLRSSGAAQLGNFTSALLRKFTRH
jgi:hypothetical protein